MLKQSNKYFIETKSNKIKICELQRIYLQLLKHKYSIYQWRLTQVMVDLCPLIKWLGFKYLSSRME